MTTWIGHENGKWTLSGPAPTTYQSSGSVTRGFCATCGTPLFYRSGSYPNETHFYAANLEDPADVIPTASYHSAERIDWLDDLHTLLNKE